MSKVETNSIPAILDAIVGSTSANGDTYLDDESLRNVEKLEAVCGWVCDRIHIAYSGDYPKQCASAERVANAVRRSSEFILDYMGIDRVELLALADKLDKDAEDIVSSAKNAQFTGSGPKMDEAKHEAYQWSCIARRIREALGADDA